MAMTDTEIKMFPIEALCDFSARVFLHFGCPKEDAKQAFLCPYHVFPVLSQILK